MLIIDRSAEGVRLACEACGAHVTLPRGDHALTLKRQRRLRCEVCGAWDHPEPRPAVVPEPALAASGS